MSFEDSSSCGHSPFTDTALGDAMTPVTVAVGAAILLLVLLAIRTPVAIALLTAGGLGLLLLDGFTIATGSIGRLTYSSVGRTSLLIIPMFVAMGLLAQYAGLATRAFLVARKLTVRLPAGLGIGTIMACAGFAAVSGSSIATVATVGRIAITEMRKHGYSKKLAAGLVAAAGTLGVLIPPSLFLVIYGIVSQQSIGRLLIAGIIPGIVSALAYAAAMLIVGWRRPAAVGGVVHSVTSGGSATNPGSATVDPPSDDQDPPASLDRDALAVSAGTYASVFLQISFLFILVVGGVYFGFYTATEAGALGALGAVVLVLYAKWRGGGQALKALKDAGISTVEITSMVFALIIGAAVFTSLMTTARIPVRMTEGILGLPVSPYLIVILLLLALVPLGMFLDGISIMLLITPIAHPVVTALGFDGLWFGILMVKMIEVGMVTPPLGVNAFVVAGVSRDISVGDVFQGVSLFLIIDAIVIALIVAMPGLVTWLPQLMRG